MESQTTYEHYDKKWLKVISQMPKGGDYHFYLRQHGYDIVKGYVDNGSNVFDYACGLGIIDKQLTEEKNCMVAGCDFSQVAVDYCNEQIKGGDFKKTGDIFGNDYDVILAIYFLEHIENPKEWLDKCFEHTNKVICVIPNNFRKVGEHVNMQWNSWESFDSLFKDYIWKRVDEGLYPSRLAPAFKHPIIIFEKDKKMHVSKIQELQNKKQLKKEKPKKVSKKKKKLSNNENIEKNTDIFDDLSSQTETKIVEKSMDMK